jgi:hypothetical protein
MPEIACSYCGKVAGTDVRSCSACGKDFGLVALVHAILQDGKAQAAKIIAERPKKPEA